MQESGVFILQSDFGQSTVADRRKNYAVTRKRNTKQGAKRQADDRVVRDYQQAPVRVRGSDVTQSGNGASGSLTRVFSPGHRISRGIGFETPDLLGKKLLCLGHGFALDPAVVDLAQAFVNPQLQSRSTRGRGSRFAGTI